MLSVTKNVIESDRSEENGKVNVEEIRAPCCGLMLRNTCNYWDVFFGIGWIKKGHRSA